MSPLRTCVTLLVIVVLQLIGPVPSSAAADAPPARWVSVVPAAGVSRATLTRNVMRLQSLAGAAVAASSAHGILLDLGAVHDRAAALTALRSETTIEQVAPAWRSRRNEPLGLTRRVIVLLSEDSPIAREQLAALGSIVQELPLVDGLVIEVAQLDEVASICARAEAVIGVRGAYPDFVRPPHYHAEHGRLDPLYPEQWYAEQTCLPVALGRTMGSADITIAVIDDGFDLEHEDLGGDARRSPYALDLREGDGWPQAEPGDEHGTAVAGIALASADNGKGIVGHCPRCSFLPIARGGTDSADIQALATAAEAGAHVINCSWGAEPSLPVQLAVERAAEQSRNGVGALVIVAAGNDGAERAGLAESITSSRVIAVAASGPDDRLLPYSNHGPKVALAAPAGAQWTTDVSAGGYEWGPYYAAFGGTSGAAPVVAGIAGLLFSLDPEADADTIAQVLLTTAAPLAGGRRTVQFGRVDAAAASAAMGGPSGALDWVRPAAQDCVPHLAAPVAVPSGGCTMVGQDGFDGMLWLLLLGTTAALRRRWLPAAGRGRPRKLPCYPRGAVTRGAGTRPERDDDLRAALEGDAKARRRLVSKLLPVVHARVARCLLRRRYQGGNHDVRALVEDYSQDVFEHLFRQGARALRNWDPARGLSLPNYVGMIAEQRVSQALRIRRQNPWTEEPTCLAKLDAALPTASSPDHQIAARMLLARVLDATRAGLSPQGREIFERLIVQEQSIGTVAAALDMRPPAVHAWSSRLKRRMRKAFADLDTATPSPPEGS